MAISIESLRAVNKCINGKYSRTLVSRTLKGKRKTVRVGEGLRYQSRSIERFNLPCFKKLIVTDFSEPLIYGEVQIYLFHQKR